MVKRPVRLQLITAFQPYIEALEKKSSLPTNFFPYQRERFMIAGPKDIANTFFWNNKNKATPVRLRGLMGNRGNAVRGNKKNG